MWLHQKGWLPDQVQLSADGESVSVKNGTRSWTAQRQE
jgi:hypothetical protein